MKNNPDEIKLFFLSFFGENTSLFRRTKQGCHESALQAPNCLSPFFLLEHGKGAVHL
jgi:hypothetical protein